MRTILKGTLLGSVIIYAWMTISWMFIPWHAKMFEHFKSDASVTTSILRNVDKGGVYQISPIMETKEEGKKAVSKRPIYMMAVVDLEMNEARMPAMYIYAFFNQLVVAFFFTLFTKLARIGSYIGRLLFVMGLAFSAIIMVLVPFWNWWQFPPIFIGIHALDLMIGWLLAGLAIAAVTRRANHVVSLQ